MSWKYRKYVKTSPAHSIHQVKVAAPNATIWGPVDLRPYLGPVRNQGQEGACTGFGETALVECLLGKKNGSAVAYKSPRWEYYQEQEVEGDPGQDNGAQIGDGISILANIGACQETLFPYVAGDLSLPDDATLAACTADAATCKVTNVAEVDMSNPNSYAAVLASFQPIVIAANVTDTFENTGSDGIVYSGGNNLGGHCMLLCGRLSPNQNILRNSWDVTWGNRGYGYVTDAWIAQYVLDGWTASI